MHVTPWTDRLALDVALMLENSGETIDEVLARHEIDKTDLINYAADPIFNKRVEVYRDDVRKHGLTFKLKARAQAEMLLDTSWVLIHAPDTSPAVKADLIKSTVKWAGLEPKGGEATGNEGSGVSITINLGEATKPMKVIEHQND